MTEHCGEDAAEWRPRSGFVPPLLPPACRGCGGVGRRAIYDDIDGEEYEHIVPCPLCGVSLVDELRMALYEAATSTDTPDGVVLDHQRGMGFFDIEAPPHIGRQLHSEGDR